MVAESAGVIEPIEDVLVAEPAVVSGVLVGYGRVSTAGQKLDRQIDALTATGCSRIFADKLSGKDADRPELAAALDYARPGDTFVVPSLDRLGRSLQDLLTIVTRLRTAGIGFRSLHEAIDTTTPGGRLVFHVFAALAEFVRELIVLGTQEGLAAARARGQRLGRPPAMSAEQVRHARALLGQPENTVASIARLLGVSRSTIYKYVPELTGTNTALGGVMDGKPSAVAAAPGNPLRCPTCGSIPNTAADRRQQRQDLELAWLYLQDGRLISRRHCHGCQPHEHVGTISCPLCGDGPMLAGAELIQAERPSQLTGWLQDDGWIEEAEAGLICRRHA